MTEVRGNRMENKNKPNQELLTIKETAKLLKVNPHRVYDLVRMGILPALKLGSLKIRRQALNEFLEEYEGMDLTDLNEIKKLEVK